MGSTNNKPIGTPNEGNAEATQSTSNPMSPVQTGCPEVENVVETGPNETPSNNSNNPEDQLLVETGPNDMSSNNPNNPEVQNLVETGPKPNDMPSNNPNNPEVQNLVETGPNNTQEENIGCCDRIRAYLCENWLALLNTGIRLVGCINELASEENCEFQM